MFRRITTYFDELYDDFTGVEMLASMLSLAMAFTLSMTERGLQAWAILVLYYVALVVRMHVSRWNERKMLEYRVQWYRRRCSRLAKQRPKPIVMDVRTFHRMSDWM